MIGAATAIGDATMMMIDRDVRASWRQMFEKIRPLVMPDCPFVNLPEKHRSRWGEGLTAEDMKICVWVRPELKAPQAAATATRYRQ